MQKSCHYDVSFSEHKHEQNKRVKTSRPSGMKDKNPPVEDVNNHEYDSSPTLSRSKTYTNANPPILIDDNNHAKLLIEELDKKAIKRDATNVPKVSFKNPIPLTKYFESLCTDRAFMNDTSDSSDVNSLADSKLADLHSKLKAETEEIRKWKKETMDLLEKVEETKPTYTFSIDNMSEISTKELNSFESKTCQKWPDNNFSNMKNMEVMSEKSEDIQMNELINQLSQCCNSIENYDQELRDAKEEKLKLERDLNKKTQYCNELELKVENFEKEMETFINSDSSNQKAHAFNLEIIKKDDIIMNLETSLQYEKQEREKEMKENERLKEQQIELKRQVTTLMTYADDTKRKSGVRSKLLSEFHEEQVKLGEITTKLKIIIGDNKSIFGSMSDELSAKSQRLKDNQELIKVLEEKLNQLESKNQQLQKDLESGNEQNQKMVEANRKLIRDSKEIMDKEAQDKTILQKVIEQLNMECHVYLERINSLQNEVSHAEENQTQLELRSDQICKKFEELQYNTAMTQDQCMDMQTKLEERDIELNASQEMLSELRLRFASLEAQKIALDQEVIELKNACSEAKHSSELEKSNLEQKFTSEIEKSQNKIFSLQQDIKKLNKNAEKATNESSNEIKNLKIQIKDLRQQKSEMIEYLYKLPTSSMKWSHFFNNSK